MSPESRKSSPSRRAKPASQGPRWKRVLRRLGIYGLVAALVMVAIFFFAYQRTEIPDPNAAYQAQATYVYYSNGKAKLGSFATQNRESIPLSEIPQSMQDAATAAEDRTFWTNKGIDPKGILRAAFSNAQGNSTQGASTITQQYVKLLYLSQERTLKRKVKEAFLSLKIQQQQSKEAILEGYLNTIYLGRGAYGVEAGARAYYGVGARDLTTAQSAVLAAMIQSPNYLSPDPKADGYDALVARYHYVIDGMVSAGNLSAAKADKIRAKPPKPIEANKDDRYGGQSGFMLTMIKQQLRKLGFTDEQIESGGLRITTTLTRGAMKASKEGVLEGKPSGKPKLHMGSASVDTHTGALLGFYGGQNYLESQLNWATIGRPPGSAFKPFALAMALENDWSLKDTFDGNSPYEFPDGSDVVNEGEGGGVDYGSAVSLLKATVDSINTAYVDLTMDTPDGAEKIKKTAIRMGIPAKAPGLNADAVISLGTANISPIQMANAYGTIANKGKAHDWFLIKKVTRASDGEVLYKHKVEQKQAIGEDVAADVGYALQQVVQQGTGARAQSLGRPAGGKTGTATNDKSDVISSWFVGLTPQVATAVIMTRGNGYGKLNDTSFIDSYFGATYPTGVWTDIMRRLMADYDVEEFAPPAYVDGTAPVTGHAPYTPPPPPPPKKHKSKPKPKPTKTTPPATPDPKPSTSTTSATPTDSPKPKKPKDCKGEPVCTASNP